MNDLDRISLLSDSLLHQILSFLEIKSVVQTCVLSKRWKTLWTNIPTLNFDFDSYPFEPSTGTVPNPRCSSVTRFIFRVFSAHHCKSIQKLTYSSSMHADEAVLVAESLISIAQHYEVEELCLNTFNTLYFDWPLGLLQCSSLTVLRMTCGFLDYWENFYLPCLKILEIRYEWKYWDYDEEYESHRELMDCPNLESFVVVDCLCERASISAKKLENLEFSASSFKWKLTFPLVELRTPNLKSVKLSNVLPTFKSTKEFSCIQEVNIAVDDSDFDGDDSPPKEYLTQGFSQLLQVFHNARSFTLPLKAMEVLLSIPPSLAGFSFHNLRRLKLETKATINTISLPVSTLMNTLKCPNLEILEVHLNQVELARTLAALEKKSEERELKMNQIIEGTKQIEEEINLLKEMLDMVKTIEQFNANFSQNRT